MLEPYDYDGPRSIHRLRASMAGVFPDFEPDFHTVVLDRRAIATDLISSSPIPNCGLLVSNRFLNLLLDFKLPPHRVYPVPMVHNDNPVDGYFFVLLPHPQSLLNAMTTADVENGVDLDPQLCGVSLLRLDRPSWMAYTWVDEKLKMAIQAARISGVKLS